MQLSRKLWKAASNLLRGVFLGSLILSTLIAAPHTSMAVQGDASPPLQAHVPAPHAAPTTSVQSVDLSGPWSFIPISPVASTPTTINVPGGGWAVQGFTTTAEAVYSRTITIPDTGQPQVTKLEFGAINYQASLYINGHFVQTNMSAFTPSVFDITSFVTPGQTYAISLDVKGKNAFVEPNGLATVADGANSSPYPAQGIFRSAELRLYPQLYIADAFVRPSISTNSLSYDVWVTNATTATQNATISSNLSSWNGDAWTYPQIPDTAVTVNPGQTQKVTIGPVYWGLGPTSYWWPNVPYQSGYTAELHNLNLSLKDGNGTTADTETYRFGFREVTQQGVNYYLNGIPVNFRGENLAGSDFDSVVVHLPGDAPITYAGDAYDRYPGFLPPSQGNPGWPQAVDNLERLNYNFVRMHLEAPSPYMLDIADEKGLMVMDELGIRGDQDFFAGHDNLVQDAHDLVVRDRNHPSVVRWSQANEPDGNPTNNTQFEVDLYNAIMANDPTRPISVDSTSYVNLWGPFSGLTQQGNFNIIPHYIGGVGQYTDDIYDGFGRPAGQGEYLWPASHSPQGFTWIATATQAMRRKNASDLRPFALYLAWDGFVPGLRTTDLSPEASSFTPPLYGADNLPDPWSNTQIQRIQAAFNPVLVADRDYWEINKLSNSSGQWPVFEDVYGYSQPETRTLDIYNDTFSGPLGGTDVVVSWEVRVDSPTGALSNSGSFRFDVPKGMHVEQQFNFTTPSSGSRFYLILTSSKNGQELFRESDEYFQLSTNPPTLTPTSTPILPSTTPTAVPTVTPSETPTAVPTVTPPEIPTSAPTSTPTNLPSPTTTAAPTSIPTSTSSPTALVTATVTPAPPSPTASPTPSPMPNHRRLSVSSLPLIVVLRSKAIVAGNSLSFAVMTAPYIHVTIAVQVVTERSDWVYERFGRRSHTHLIILYMGDVQGRADAHGRFKGHIRVPYSPPRSMPANLAVTVGTAAAATTREMSFTIQPSIHRATRHLTGKR